MPKSTSITTLTTAKVCLRRSVKAKAKLLCWIIGLVGATSLLIPTETATAQSIAGQPTRFTDDDDSRFLEEELTPEFLEQFEAKLNAILRTRRDEEKKFIASVVAKVSAGQLPIKLVTTSFRWVQENRPESKFPFIYFEKVLRLQAAKLELEDAVPPYEFTNYGSVGQRRTETSAGRANDELDQDASDSSDSANSGNAADSSERPRLITLVGSASGRLADLFRLGASKLKSR